MAQQNSPFNQADLNTTGLGKLNIEIHEGFDALANDWQLLESEGVCSLYQRIDWVRPWTENVAGPARVLPRLAIGRTDAEPLFILPLGIRKRGPFNVATWLGDSHSNFHMGIFSKSFIQNARRQDVRDVVDCVVGLMGRVDVLEMCCQPVVWQGFTNPFTFLDWQESHNHAYALDLSAGFEDAINRKNGARKRKKYRWQQNKVKDVGGAELRIATTEEEVDSMLDVSFAQIAGRFNRAGIWNRFEDSGIETFIRQMAKESLGDDEPQLLIYGLEIAGELRATLAGGINKGQFSGCFISLTDGEYSNISPGEMIIHLVIRDCCSRGLTNFVTTQLPYFCCH
ncbi:MAG: GNAT family N-acetyltransferase [Rhizobiaceae bacterium]|nr:GNAT family N-acetyltransferase [Rhizobiaceae bacterium]